MLPNFGRAWQKFISRQYLLDLSNGLLNNDKLKLRCYITFSVSLKELCKKKL